MALHWSSSLETGVAEIDLQHREFIARINRVFDACGKGQSAQELLSVLAFLEEYVVVHFGMEERHMKASGYPHYEQHKAQHDGFIRAFGELKREVDAGGAGLNARLSANRLLTEWLSPTSASLTAPWGNSCVPPPAEPLPRRPPEAYRAGRRWSARRWSSPPI
ncbi:MAG: hemerythrin family protein [Deltaproteobacteria bacterium]|nr:hemerythrin family protein [Deltaproteobacteria bacterium]